MSLCLFFLLVPGILPSLSLHRSKIAERQNVVLYPLDLLLGHYDRSLILHEHIATGDFDL